MLYYALVALVIAIIAGILGFGGIAKCRQRAGWLLFFGSLFQTGSANGGSGFFEEL